jgi:hypothetical protein
MNAAGPRPDFYPAPTVLEIRAWEATVRVPAAREPSWSRLKTGYEGTVVRMPDGANAATELAWEHGQIERLSSRIAMLSPCDEREALVRDVAQRFLSHVQAEQKFLYPALRRFYPQGELAALEQIRRQQAVEQVIKRLDHMGEGDEERDALIGRLVVEIQAHIEHQDGVLLPVLAKTCPPEEANHLGRQLRGSMREMRQPNELAAGEDDRADGGQVRTPDGANGAAAADPGSRRRRRPLTWLMGHSRTGGKLNQA